MRRLLPRVMLCTALLGACAPSPESAPPAADASTGDSGTPQADAATSVTSVATCETTFGVRICHGLLSPPSLGAGITDVLSSGSPGQHFFCYPDGGTSRGQLLIHLVGTGSDPARDNSFTRYACSLGYAAISPMYKNDRDARSTCEQTPGCYEAMRKEIVYGQDLWPSPIEVDAANSVMNRVQTLLAGLAVQERRFSEWARWSERFAARDFSAIAVSGHSQGSGHALLLARDFAVTRGVMLGGLTDRLDSGKPTHSAVAWLANWGVSNPRTPAERLFGYNHQDDAIAIFAQVLANYDAIGLAASECAFSNTGPYPAACRRINTPSAGCGPLNAHTTVIAARFSPTAPCSVGVGTSQNAATWRFLLTAQ